MDHSVKYRSMKKGEERDVIERVEQVFHQFVAPLFNNEGVTEFMKYADPHALAERIKGESFVLVAESEGEIIGIIEIRKYSHISLFFIKRENQCKGVGRELVRKAVQKCKAVNCDLIELTVNASPNAVSAYHALGFLQRDEEKCANGIRFVPMSLAIDTRVAPASIAGGRRPGGLR
jgi:GNAT superfamily N-acetyltransferase